MSVVSLCFKVRENDTRTTASSVLEYLVADSSVQPARWKEALLASSTHPAGSRIVPLVNLNGTSITVLGEDPKRKVTMEEIRRFEEGRKMA